VADVVSVNVLPMPLSATAFTTTPLRGVSWPFVSSTPSPSSQYTLPSMCHAAAGPATNRTPRRDKTKVRASGRTVGRL